jgi:hypothetical protein
MIHNTWISAVANRRVQRFVPDTIWRPWLTQLVAATLPATKEQHGISAWQAGNCTASEWLLRFSPLGRAISAPISPVTGRAQLAFNHINSFIRTYICRRITKHLIRGIIYMASWNFNKEIKDKESEFDLCFSCIFHRLINAVLCIIRPKNGTLRVVDGEQVGKKIYWTPRLMPSQKHETKWNYQQGYSVKRINRNISQRSNTCTVRHQSVLKAIISPAHHI